MNFLPNKTMAKEVIAILVLVLQVFKVGSLMVVNNNDKITSLPGQPSVKFQQFSGYVETNNHKSLFYYFVEAESHPLSKPLVLWLNGGPGCSSLGVGAFSENGPFRPTQNALTTNHFSWNKGF